MVVAMLWFVGLLNYLDRQMLSTMRPFMEGDIADLVSATNFGRLMAIFLWIYAFMSPFAGMIADRLNRKWLIVGSLFVWSGVTFLMSYAQNFDQLYMLRAVMGVSEAFYIPAALSLIADYHQGKTRAFAIGVHSSGICLGQALGGFGAPLAAVSSWQFTFYACGMVGILYSLLLIALLREKKTYAAEASARHSVLASAGFALKGLAVLFSNVSFWVILYYFSAPAIPTWATKNWLPTLFSETLQMDMSRAGPLATVSFSAASLVGVLIGGFCSDRWVQRNLKGRIYLSAIALGCMMPSLFAIGYGDGLFWVLGGALAIGLSLGVLDAGNMPILCQFVPSRYRATAYGLLNMTGMVAGALITSELGKAMDAGYTNTVFAVMAAIVLPVIILQLTVLRPKTINMTDELMGR